VLDVYCDPNIPPIPPHATVEQIKSVTEAVLRGDPDAWDIVTKGLRTKLTELLPGKR
jgi:pyruvate dehydrogenase (quinone)